MDVFRTRKKLLQGLDDMAVLIGKQCCHQSDRDYPRSVFSHGITSISRKSASDMTGILFVLSIAFVCARGEQMFSAAFMDDSQLEAYQRLAEWLLCFDVYYNKSSFCTLQLESDKELI